MCGYLIRVGGALISGDESTNRALGHFLFLLDDGAAAVSHDTVRTAAPAIAERRSHCVRRRRRLCHRAAKAGDNDSAAASRAMKMYLLPVAVPIEKLAAAPRRCYAVPIVFALGKV